MAENYAAFTSVHAQPDRGLSGVQMVEEHGGRTVKDWEFKLRKDDLRDSGTKRVP